MLNRRSFLKLSSSAVASMSWRGRTSSGQGATEDSVVYAGRFEPRGAECRLAFVSDHHYWPDHSENWGGGAQITSNCNRRMPDLIEVLNDERPDLSVHGGDVISAGGSFFPPPEEYARQLEFTKKLYDGLRHPSMPLIGNHETLEARVVSRAQFEPWIRHFGPPYRHHDARGWRIVGLNCILPAAEAGAVAGDRELYGLDPSQMKWLRDTLREAADRKSKVVLCAHVPPAQWVNARDFEKVITEPGCVKAIVCGHAHRNFTAAAGGIPVLVRIANVSSPMGYTMLHLYPDGRILVVQKSQHFPFDDFISSGFQSGNQGTETDRYFTLGGSSELPLQGLRVTGPDAAAVVRDGHLRLTSGNGRAAVLIDGAQLPDARLSLTAVKTPGERMGAIALAGPDGEDGIEATLTSRYSPDGKVYLARTTGARREVLARTWFNIGDDIAYRLVLEVRNGEMTASWKNLGTLKARVAPASRGSFGFFVERGTLFVTDLRLERLAPA